jgi:hypothetical protein
MEHLSIGQRMLVRVVATVVVLTALWAMGFLQFGGPNVVS